MLPAGAAFDLTTRELRPQPGRVSDEDAAELAEAQADLQQMARDIDAGDVARPPCGDVWPASARPARLSPPIPLEPQPAGDIAEQDGASR